MLHELGKQTNALLKTADEAVNDAKTLHDRLDKSRRILEHNYNTSEMFKNKYYWNLNDMKGRTEDFFEKQINNIEGQMEEDRKNFSDILSHQNTLQENIGRMVKESNSKIQSSLNILKEQVM